MSVWLDPTFRATEPTDGQDRLMLAGQSEGAVGVTAKIDERYELFLPIFQRANTGSIRVLRDQ